MQTPPGPLGNKVTGQGGSEKHLKDKDRRTLQNPKNIGGSVPSDKDQAQASINHGACPVRVSDYGPEAVHLQGKTPMLSDGMNKKKIAPTSSWRNNARNVDQISNSEPVLGSVIIPDF